MTDQYELEHQGERQCKARVVVRIVPSQNSRCVPECAWTHLAPCTRMVLRLPNSFWKEQRGSCRDVRLSAVPIKPVRLAFFTRLVKALPHRHHDVTAEVLGL
jgi:hypothetical protein